MTVTNISSTLFANNSAQLEGGINFVNEKTFQNNSATQYGASVQYQQQCSDLESDFGKLLIAGPEACTKLSSCNALKSNATNCMLSCDVGFSKGNPGLVEYLQRINKHCVTPETVHTLSLPTISSTTTLQRMVEQYYTHQTMLRSMSLAMRVQASM